MRLYKVFVIIIVLCYMVVPQVTAQSVHSNLRNPQQLKMFKRISDRLMCQCGCKMVLSNCTHSTCVAWSMREAIDSLILQGKTEDQIVAGFRDGFGSLVDTDEAFSRVRRENNLVSNLKNGLAQEALSEPENKNPGYYVFFAALVFATLAGFYLKKRVKKLDSNDNDEEVPLTEEEKKLYEKLHE